MKSTILALLIALGTYQALLGQTWFPEGAQFTYTLYSHEAGLYYTSKPLNIGIPDTVNGFTVAHVEVDDQCEDIDIAHLGFRNDSLYYFNDSLDFFLLFQMSQTLPYSFTTYRPDRCFGPSYIGYDTLNYTVDSVATETFNGIDVQVFRGTVLPSQFTTWVQPFIFYEYFGFASWQFPDICDNCESDLQELRCYEDSIFGSVNFLNSPCDTVINVGLRDLQIASNFAQLIHQAENANPIIEFTEAIEAKNLKLYVLNAFGQVINEQKIEQGSRLVTIDTKAYVEGIYFIEIFNDHQKLWQGKFVKY